MHALIIEDEAFIASYIEAILLDRGFISIDIAACLEDGVEAAMRRRPSLITADVRIAGAGSGIDAVKAICANAIIPTIFVTGSRAEVDEQMPGATIVLKPFTPRDLHNAIDQCVGKSAS